MKNPILVIALLALLATCGLGLASQPAAQPPPPGSDPLPLSPSQAAAVAGARSQVPALSRAIRARARNLGLMAPAPVRVGRDPHRLLAQRDRLEAVRDYLAERREIISTPSERRAAVNPGFASLDPLMRPFERARRHSVRLGLDAPAAPVVPSDPALGPTVIARWRAISTWLSERRERPRPQEIPAARRFPHYAGLMCIAGHESKHTWDINTGNGYYGGLQMDRDFQQTYAPRLYASLGTADRWTMEQQLEAAEEAIKTRSFTPWPNTARMCGLL